MTTPLSPIHPLSNVKPGRYMLDEIGMLWPPLVKLPFRMVAAVIVLAPGELTRRQRAELPVSTNTDDDRANAEAAIKKAINEAIEEGAIAGSREFVRTNCAPTRPPCLGMKSRCAPWGAARSQELSQA